MLADFSAVAAGDDHFQTWPLLLEAFGKFQSADALRQNHVREQELNLVRMVGPEFRGRFAVGRLNYRVAQLLQRASR